MIIFSKILKNLQSKPYEDRVRILWMIVIIAGVGIIGIWAFSLKSTIGGLDGENLIDLQPTVQSNSITTDNLLSVERIEQDENALIIYFFIENPTTDILNFPQPSDITLTAEDRGYHPLRIADRQNTPFAVKILSNSKNFGTLFFEPVQSSTGVLVFDNLFYETAPNQTIKQEFDLDFKSLNQTIEIRN